MFDYNWRKVGFETCKITKLKGFTLKRNNANDMYLTSGQVNFSKMKLCKEVRKMNGDIDTLAELRKIMKEGRLVRKVNDDIICENYCFLTSAFEEKTHWLEICIKDEEKKQVDQDVERAEEAEGVGRAFVASSTLSDEAAYPLGWPEMEPIQIPAK